MKEIFSGDSPPAPAALAAKVRTLAPSMTRSMQLVAEAVAGDPAGCAALTVTGLAELTGTSEATVVRTARLLGYPGYRDLRLAWAGLAAHQESGRSPAVTADIAVDDPIAEVVAKLAFDEQQTLADTAAGLDTVQLGAAVAAAATARRIDIYGVGASFLVGQDLAQKLLRIGLIAHAHADPHLAVTNAVQLRAGDVAIAITHSGSTGDVIEPLRVAFDRGATTVADRGFVGYNTAKEFGGTPILGGAVAAIIVFPGVANIDAFGQTLSPGQGGVLGALGAAVLAVYVEKWCRRWVPEALDVLVTPTLTVLISGLVTIFGLMYVAGEVSSAIGTFADWLLANGGAGAGFVLGGLFLPLVMLGLHQALIPIHTTLIEQQGYTVLLPILAMAGAGQVGAAMAVYFRLPRNESIRRTIRSALPAGLLGVGEPLIYGVSLPLGRPFITACVGGAFGGGFVGLFNQLGDKVGSTAIGPSGWALFPLVDGNHGLGTTIAIYAGGLLVGYVAGFAATYFFGFSKDLLSEFNVSQKPTPSTVAATGNTHPGSPAKAPAGV
ncbi:HTH-type transcriptional regulator MurR [Streptomyces microflavus]